MDPLLGFGGYLLTWRLQNVPIAWKSLQDIWKWEDEVLVDDPPDINSLVDERQPWWEKMADMVAAKWGRLNLA